MTSLQPTSLANIHAAYREYLLQGADKLEGFSHRRGPFADAATAALAKTLAALSDDEVVPDSLRGVCDPEDGEEILSPEAHRTYEIARVRADMQHRPGFWAACLLADAGLIDRGPYGPALVRKPD